MPLVADRPKESAAYAIFPSCGSNKTVVPRACDSTLVQLVPPSLERQMPKATDPPPYTAANNAWPFVGLTARERIFAPAWEEVIGPTNGPGKCVHVAPPSVDNQMRTPNYI